MSCKTMARGGTLLTVVALVSLRDTSDPLHIITYNMYVFQGLFHDNCDARRYTRYNSSLLHDHRCSIVEYAHITL